jgi:hypothetical protein
MSLEPSGHSTAVPQSTALTNEDIKASPATAEQTPQRSEWIFGYPGDESASYWGHGIDEALEIIRAIEKVGIPCCIVGIHALGYCGARRVPDVSHSWEYLMYTAQL